MTTAEPTNPNRPNRAGVEAPPRRSALNIALWIVQVLLALLFIWAGGLKLVMPVEQMQQGPVHLPELFLRFIGVCELLGGLGLLLPSLLRIKPGLTPLAAAGLVIIMIGAVCVTLAGGGDMVKMAVVPAVTGILAAFVAYGRWKLVPLRGRG